MINDWIGSWSVDDLIEWRTQINSFYNHKIDSHTVICWSTANKKFIYKNLNILHTETIPDLTSKYPDCFYFICMSKSMLEWGKIRDINKVFPTTTLEHNVEIPGILIENTEEKLVVEIDNDHYTTKNTFCNIDLGLEDMFTTNTQNILIDFDNSRSISSIIDGEKTFNHHLLMGQ